MGITGANTTSINPQIVVLICSFTEQYKNGFPSLEKLEKKCRSCEGKNAQELQLCKEENDVNA